MGVTAIKKAVNESSLYTVVITNLENPTKAGNRVSLARGGSSPCDIWIPWCTSADDFLNNRYIKIEGSGLATRYDPPAIIATYRIWQARHNDGDYVRVSTGPNYVIPGTRINGESRVDGDRMILIKDGYVELVRI